MLHDCPLYGVRRRPGFSIIVSSTGGSWSVRSRGGVLSSEGPLIEVLLYSYQELLCQVRSSKMQHKYMSLTYYYSEQFKELNSKNSAKNSQDINEDCSTGCDEHYISINLKVLVNASLDSLIN